MKMKMIKLTPIYKFKVQTAYSPREVKHQISRLLRKEENTKSRLNSDGAYWGVEVFDGIVEEEYFKLKRCAQVAVIHGNSILYKGIIEPDKNGSIIRMKFRYQFSAIFLMILIPFATTMNFFYSVFDGNIVAYGDDLGGFIAGLFVYLGNMIAFNYRCNKVEKLLKIRLNADRE